jgi:cytochrome c
MGEYGCAGCHDVPGLRRSETSWVAPPLTRYRERSFVAGVLVNTEANLIRWIVDPQEVNPGTAMPVLGVTELEARDMAAYLHSSS